MLAEFWNHWATPILWLAGITAVGFVIDSVIYSVLQRRAKRRHERVGQEIARAIHGFPTAVAFIVGARVGIVRADLSLERLELANKVLVVLAIVVITAFAARIAGRTIRVYTSREDAALPSSSIFVNLARGVIWLIGGLTILAALGISIAPLLTALGVGGLAIGLALQDTLGNLFAGIQVLLSRQVEPGDYIRLETGEEGTVVDVTWRNTTIKMLSNDLVIVPNAKLGSGLVTNFTTDDAQTILWVNVGVAYGSDLDHVERVTREVAAEVANAGLGADPTFESVLRFDAFGDSSIDLRVSLKANQYSDRWAITTEMIKRLHRRYSAEGIEIPFPQRVVTMAKGAGE